MELLSDYRAWILPVVVIIELIALAVVIREIWTGAMDDIKNL